MKLIFAVMLIVVLGALLWGSRDSAFVRQFLQPAASLPSPIRFDNGVPGLPAAGDPTPADQGGRAGVRKCLRAAEVLYTDGSCPAGSREAKLTGGAVTVVPGQPTAVLPSMPPAAASRPNIRDLLLPAGEANLRDRQMDKVIGK